MAGASRRAAGPAASQRREARPDTGAAVSDSPGSSATTNQNRAAGIAEVGRRGASGEHAREGSRRRERSTDAARSSACRRARNKEGAAGGAGAGRERVDPRTTKDAEEHPVMGVCRRVRSEGGAQRLPWSARARYLPIGAVRLPHWPHGPASGPRPMRLRITSSILLLSAPLAAQQPRQLTAEDYARAE